LTKPQLTLQCVTLLLVTQEYGFLWEHGPATGEAVRAATPSATFSATFRQRDCPLDHSNRAPAPANQYVRYQMGGRQFLYSSAREPHKGAAEAVRGLLLNF
jgi:hypothetical protein